MDPLTIIAAGALIAYFSGRRKIREAPSRTDAIGPPQVIDPACPATTLAALRARASPTDVIVQRQHTAATGLLAVGAGVGLLAVGISLTSVIAVSVAIGAVRAAMLAGSLVRDCRARRWPARSRAWPTVTVVIPAHNEEASIAGCLRSVAIAGRGLGHVQILVVDDGSSDGTLDRALSVAAEYSCIEVCTHWPNRGKAAALNRALAIAQGGIIVTVDADTTLDPAALAAIATPLVEDGAVAAVAGKVMVGNRGRLVTDWQAIEYIATFHSDRLWQNALGCIITVPGAFGAWRTSVLRAQGGFSSMTLAEDTELTLAVGLAGGKIVYAPDALAYTSAPDTWDGLYRQRTRWLRGNLQSAAVHVPRWPMAPSGYALLGFPDFAWRHTVGLALIPLGVTGLFTFGTLSGALFALYGLDLVPLAVVWAQSGERWRDFAQLPFQRVGFLLVTSTALANVAAQVVRRQPTAWSGQPLRLEPAVLDAKEAARTGEGDTILDPPEYQAAGRVPGAVRFPGI